jgi:23S rRNA pseudouridine1911/1915/1917 synthase
MTDPASSSLNGTQWTFSVNEEAETDRLDRFLAASAIEEPELSTISRERIQGLIKEERVLVNGKLITKSAYRLNEGDQVSLFVPEATPISLEAESIPLNVVFEDEHLLVINKARGMLTHPTGRERTGTLVNALLAHCGDSLSGINGRIRPGIVHRLDRDTSGLLMVAKTDAAHIGLSEQIRSKSARRTYRAIAQGKFNSWEGTVDAPIGRNPKQRDKMAVISNGRPSRTHWRVVDTVDDRFALLELDLETGRTHQIRVHCAHIGHPLVADPLYGSGLERQLDTKSKGKLHLKSTGQMLQAVRLAFRHPISNEDLKFSIDLEPAIADVWEWLQQSK